MYKIIINSEDIKYEAVISETELKEIFRLLETSKIYKLEHLHRIDNGASGEDIIELLKTEIRDNFIQG